MDDVAAFAGGSRASVGHVEAVNAEHDFKPGVAEVFDDELVAAAFAPDDVAFAVGLVVFQGGPAVFDSPLDEAVGGALHAADGVSP